jgi:hypothetical protein
MQNINILVYEAENENDMENMEANRWATPRSWCITVVSLLPLWLLSLAIMVEGFPPPPISGELAITAFVLAIAVSIVLLWKRWMTVELVLYSFFPFYLLYAFDEISTTYKTPFIILCALILTIGVIGYQRSRLTRFVRVLVLLLIVFVTYALAWNAALNFWQMASDLGYVHCFPDAHGCAPLTGHETPWWVLFFTF